MPPKPIVSLPPPKRHTAVIQVKKNQPTAHFPFLVTRFVNQEANGFYYDGYEICLPTDPRAIMPSPELKHFFGHHGYLVDSSRVILSLPSIAYTFLQDEASYPACSRAYNGSECQTTSELRTQLGNILMEEDQAAIPKRSRVLFIFPDDEGISNEGFGEPGSRQKIKCDAVVVPHRHVLPNQTIDVVTGRLTWRVTIKNPLARKVRRNATATVPIVTNLMAQLQTGNGQNGNNNGP